MAQWGECEPTEHVERVTECEKPHCGEHPGLPDRDAQDSERDGYERKVGLCSKGPRSQRRRHLKAAMCAHGNDLDSASEENRERPQENHSRPREGCESGSC